MFQFPPSARSIPPITPHPRTSIPPSSLRRFASECVIQACTHPESCPSRAFCVIDDAALKPSSFTSPARSRKLSAIAKHIAAVVLLLYGGASAQGQDAVPAVSGSSANYPVSAPAPAPLVETTPATEPDVQPAEIGGQPYSPQPRRFQYGLLFRVRGVYDDNINISSSDRISDYYVAIEPTITVGVGDVFEKQENYLRLDYTPSVFLFVDHSEDDAVQHLV